MIYLTYGESPSAVYSSQVIDACFFLRREFDVQVRLVAFVSPRVWKQARRDIRREIDDAIVLPALPRVATWWFNAAVFAILCFVLKEHCVIARSIPATNIALFAKNMRTVRRVCYDGRGAIAAERREYLESDARRIRRFANLESSAVKSADFRIAVSSRLIDYWKEACGYSGMSHVVIPCTLSSSQSQKAPTTEESQWQRHALGFRSTDFVVVYAGSTSGWQSLGLMAKFVESLLASREDAKALFLTDRSEVVDGLIERFNARVQQRRVEPAGVGVLLSACDYGLLIRERTITNLVASPTKVAEYLAAGLPVIVSDAIGDYADFIREHKCGVFVPDVRCADLRRPSVEERQRISHIARNELTKAVYRPKYNAVVDCLLQRTGVGQE